MTYEAWRCTYQSSEQAARAAYDTVEKLAAQRDELLDALIGLDDAYCRSGSDLTREERTEDRKRLIAARAVITKANALLAEPHPDADGWVKWNGGECPAPDDTWVEVLLRNGENDKDQAADWLWNHGLGDGDIIAYRIVKAPQ